MLQPGLACDVVGEEQPRGEGGMKFSVLGAGEEPWHRGMLSWGGTSQCPLPRGQPPASPQLCSIPFAPAGKGRFGFRGSIPLFCWASQDPPDRCFPVWCRFAKSSSWQEEVLMVSPMSGACVPSPAAAGARCHPKAEKGPLSAPPERDSNLSSHPGHSRWPLLVLQAASSALNRRYFTAGEFKSSCFDAVSSARRWGGDVQSQFFPSR